MEDFVTFEIARELKEKGFPQHITEDAYIIDNYGEDEYQIGDRLPIPLIPDYMDDIAAPTISQVLKWLREEKKIHIGFGHNPRKKWRFVIMYIDDRFYNNPTLAMDDFHSYEEATLAGIEYVLDNLINK